MGLTFYYCDGLQPKMSAGIINEHECSTNKGIITLLNFGNSYEDNLWVIFVQWLTLHLGLDVLSNQKILKGIYYACIYMVDVYVN